MTNLRGGMFGDARPGREPVWWCSPAEWLLSSGCGLGTGPKKILVPRHNIPKLGKFVELPSPHVAPEPRHPGVCRASQHGAGISTAINHRAKLHDRKLAAILPRTLLVKEYRPTRSQPCDKSNGEYQWKK